MSHSQRLLRFFIIGCLLLLMFEGYHQLKMVQADHGRSHAETRADMKNIVPSLSLAQLRTYLTQSEKPSLLFIYASWCPHCQRMAPYISELAEANPHSLQVIALSVDRNPEQLADYLRRTRPPFTTYTPAYEESERLAAALQQFGIRYDGGIPHSAIFNAHGELVVDFGGYVDKTMLTKYLNRLEGF